MIANVSKVVKGTFSAGSTKPWREEKATMLVARDWFTLWGDEIASAR